METPLLCLVVLGNDGNSDMEMYVYVGVCTLYLSWY